MSEDKSSQHLSGLVEEVARIIDPHAWSLWPDDGPFPAGDVREGQKRVRSASLTKARLILALPALSTSEELERLGEVVEVLRPFADEAVALPDGAAFYVDIKREHAAIELDITTEHFRKASALLSKLEGEASRDLRATSGAPRGASSAPLSPDLGVAEKTPGQVAYERHTANHPVIHSNRFAAWSEIHPKLKESWERSARTGTTPEDLTP